MPELTITHSAAEGTLVLGTAKGDGSAEILKTRRFRWSRNIGARGAWYLPNSRDRFVRKETVESARVALEGHGFTVTVEIDDEQRSAAEREADRAERLAERADRLDDRAERLGAEASARFERAHTMMSVIPLGQPMMPDHHSYNRDRNYRARIDTTMGKAVETHREAQEAERRAEASRQQQGRRESGPATVRRIDRLETELRDINRKLTGKPCPLSGAKLKADHTVGERSCRLCGEPIVYTADSPVVPTHYLSLHKPATGAGKTRLDARAEALNDEIAYWRRHLDEIGYVLPSADQFHKGQRVRIKHGFGTVVRVNKKTLTVRTDASGFELKYGYEEVHPMEEVSQ